MYLNRIIEKAIINISRQYPAVLLTGPRQVGKTTLLKYLSQKERRYITLDDLNVRELAKDDPKLFIQQFPAPVLIDEIQYAPELLPYIKIEIDKHRINGNYWLTGSQQYHVMKGVTETLAGRIAIVNLFGFSQKERLKLAREKEPFLPDGKGNIAIPFAPDIKKIYNFIWRGAFPVPIINKSVDINVFYNSYLQTYLQRDVHDLTQVGNIRQFTRFIKACAARTGQLLNYSELAKDTDISVMTAKHWISILEASFIIYLLQPFSGNLTKRLIKTPKLYFVDTGLCAWLTGWTSPDTLMNGAMAGAIFETYVVSEIFKSRHNHAKPPNLFFYRDKDGNEIDLIIEKDNQLYPVEIKKSAMVKRNWIKNFNVMKKFTDDHFTGGIICLTEQIVPINENIYAYPVSVI